MSDTLIVILAGAAAIAAGMAFAAWRIKRLQYPPELRWPTARKKRPKPKRGSDDDAPA